LANGLSDIRNSHVVCARQRRIDIRSRQRLRDKSTGRAIAPRAKTGESCGNCATVRTFIEVDKILVGVD
jgi:hypothetical protein